MFVRPPGKDQFILDGAALGHGVGPQGVDVGLRDIVKLLGDHLFIVLGLPRRHGMFSSLLLNAVHRSVVEKPNAA